MISKDYLIPKVTVQNYINAKYLHEQFFILLNISFLI